NLPHLLVNMSGLYLFGRVVEAAVGPRRFLGVYLISGLTGSVVSLLAAPGAQAAGASGAIFGLVGWVLHFRLRRLERRWLPIDSILIQILVLNVLLALVLPNLDHAGHLGGLAGGALAGSLLGLHRPGERRPNVRESSAAALALGILIWVGLNPLSAAAAIDPVAPASARWMESRFGHYFIETRTAGASVWWRYADEPIAWRPMERQFVLRPDRPVQFAAA